MPGLDGLQFEFTGIGKVLGSRRLAVPKYQRSYSWTDEEVTELWDDLTRAIDEGSPDYFLGTLVLSTSADDSASSEEDLPAVIDGQQRLATASLLLAAMRDLYLAEGTEQMMKRVELVERFLLDTNVETLESEPRLVLNEENADFFQKTAVARPNDREALTPSVPSQQKIQDAFTLLSKKVAEVKQDAGTAWEKELVALQVYLENKARVVLLEVPNEANAYLIFETLNDRGLDLTIADLLKNYLFSRAGRNKISTVKQSWDRAFGALDPGEDDKLQTTFLRHYWSSKHGYTREKELYSRIKQKVTSQKDAIDFGNELVEAARIYSALRNPSHEFWATYSTPTKANLDTLLMLDVTQSRPLLMAVMQQWQKGQITKALAHLVSWSVRLIVVGGAGSGSTEAAFSNAAVDVRSGKIKDAKALAATMKSVVPDDSRFEAQFSVTSKKARLARYLLHALQRNKDGTHSPELISNADETQVNLEHILPRDQDPKEWPQFTAEQHASYFNRLGNLALLDAKENGALNAKNFKAKAAVYETSKLSLTSELGDATKYPDWTPATIESRQSELAKLAVTTWPQS
jgi:uncharacterized protein with ParB-like and HNH nuclease domain